MERNTKVLYDDKNNMATSIDNQYLNIYKLGGNFEDLKKYRDSIGAKEDYLKDYLVYLLINYFTLNSEFEDAFMEISSLLQDFEDIEIYINGDSISITSNKYEVFAKKLTNVVSNLNNIIGIDMESIERAHQCHLEAFNLSLNLAHDNKLITSYAYGCTDKSKLLHSFVEIKLGDKEFVLDPTINAMIDKNGFYKMHHIKRSDIISVIDNKDLLNDNTEYGDLFNALGINIRDYEVFRNEFISEFNKKDGNGKLI